MYAQAQTIIVHLKSFVHLLAAYFFASPVDVEIKLDGEDDRKKVDMKSEKEKMITCPVFYDGDGVAGTVRLIGADVLSSS